jgi:hypothetical protein
MLALLVFNLFDSLQRQRGVLLNVLYFLDLHPTGKHPVSILRRV